MTILEYESPQAPLPRWREALYRLRIVLLVAYAALLAGAVAFYVWLDADGFLVVAGLLVFLGVQALFLLGMPALRWPRPTRRKAMASSLITGSAIAALITFGLCATALNFFDVWKTATNAVGGHIFWTIVVAWAAWLFVFSMMLAGQWLGGFVKLYKLLVAGTWLELLVTIPVDVQVRHRTKCYCGEGTFFALIIGSSLAIWSFGPGLVLLFLTRRLQREAYFSACLNCGADLSAVNERRCPTCDARIPRNVRRQQADRV
jgi:hypothetical protein